MDASFLEVLHVIAGAAGQALLEMYGAASLPVDYKGPGDPVTAADRRSNRLIVERLNQAFPEIPVVAEESEPDSFKGFHEAERVFFVDPLDGTQGTWIPVHVSATDELTRARIVASRSHRSAPLERALASLSAREVRPMGSAGLKGAQVAEGLADGYVDTGASTKQWDACAIDALVTAAAGRVSDLTGAPIDYRGPTLANERGLVVSNGLTHEAILAKLARQVPPERR